MILTGLTKGQENRSAVRVTVARGGGAPQLLRHLTLSPGHFVAYPTLGAGPWRFSVTATVGGTVGAAQP